MNNLYKSKQSLKIIFFALVCTLSYNGAVHAQTSFSSGSFIINMGVTPQTKANGLKPYGMVYDLIKNYNTPVVWSINPAKVKDGTDFTYNSIAYKGGPFIIPKEFITSAVTARITYWLGQGVQGIYTTSAFTAPVYDTLTSFPKIMIDNGSGNTGIITDYYVDAAIPAASYSVGVPANLTNCFDIWTNPHDDPTWATHNYLYNFVTSLKGNIWAECHEVSMMEALKNPASPFQQLNFLTSNGLQCYDAGKCSGITEAHAGNPDLSPVTYNHHSDPMMQFMGVLTGATQGGSEQWYVPLSTGGWNSSTKRAVTTDNGVSPREGVLVVYGPAYGNTSNGYVMYEAGHNLDASGSTAEKVAAQRAHLNFLLFTGGRKKLVLSASVPAFIDPGSTVPVSVAIAAGTGSAPFTYQWSSRLGGTFANSTAASTTYTAPSLVSDTTDVITVKVTDACGRVNFRAIYVQVRNTGSLPVTLSYYNAVMDHNTVVNTWITASEYNNDYFTVERSKDAKYFESIGTVDGYGTSKQINKYSFTDPSPYTGVSYYRLKQTDFDGKTAYSNIVSVNNDTGYSPSVSIYPNPSEGLLSVEFADFKESDISLQIYDISGKMVLDKSVSIKNNNSVQLNLSSLSKGVYFIIYSTDRISKFQKFFIQ